ncbi:MAG: hypothetical protein ABEJ61_00725 [Haloferacaceae archaeon]
MLPSGGNERASAAGGSTRRRFLAATAAMASVGGAGCSGVRRQSFAARPVVLPDEGREALWLGETSRDSQTVSRDGPVGTEIEVTSHAAVYDRAAGLEGE